MIQFHYSDVDWNSGSDAEWEAWRPGQKAAPPGLHRPKRPASARPARHGMSARFTNWYHAAIDDFAAKKRAKREDHERRRSGGKTPLKKVSQGEFLRWYEDALRTKSRNYARLKEKYDSDAREVEARAQHSKPVSKAHFEQWYVEALARQRRGTGNHPGDRQEKGSSIHKWPDDSRARLQNVRQPAPVFNASHFNDWVEQQTLALNEHKLD